MIIPRRKQSIKRFPRIRKPKIIEKGAIFKFRPNVFRYKLITYLNRHKTPYYLTLNKEEGYYILEILGDNRNNIRFLKRNPRYVVRAEEFQPIYYQKKKPKEKVPELFHEMKTLEEKFLRLGRRLAITCLDEPSRHYKPLQFCFCRCKKKCENFNLKNIIGPIDDEYECLKDILKLQRISNLIYGTIREQDIFIEND